MSGRVLVVDDEPDVLRLLTFNLERAGFAPGSVRHEWYSLLARSAGNRFRSQLPYADRRRSRVLRAPELPWGFALAACHTSSAIQVVAKFDPGT